MSAKQSERFSETVFPVHDLHSTRPEQTYPFSIHLFDPKAPAYQTSKPHRHTFYHVLYITAGQGFHVVDFEPLLISPPVLFFVSPGQVHFWRLEVPLQGYGLVFSPDFMALSTVDATGIDKLSLFHSLALKPLHLGLDQSSSVRETVESLFREYEARELNYVSVVSAYLHILLSKMERLYATIKPDISTGSSTELVRRFKRLASSHCLDQRSISFYADQLGVSPAHLSKSIKASTGYTAGEIVRQELLLEAKRLLINTELTIEQISYQLTFNDPAYFGRFFKRETGSSPGQYRKETLEKYQIKHV